MTHSRVIENKENNMQESKDHFNLIRWSAFVVGIVVLANMAGLPLLMQILVLFLFIAVVP
jgi:hypothetical protein